MDILRGHWLSETRRLNRHYQSGGHSTAYHPPIACWWDFTTDSYNPDTQTNYFNLGALLNGAVPSGSAHTNSSWGATTDTVYRKFKSLHFNYVTQSGTLITPEMFYDGDGSSNAQCELYVATSPDLLGTSVPYDANNPTADFAEYFKGSYNYGTFMQFSNFGLLTADNPITYPDRWAGSPYSLRYFTDICNGVKIKIDRKTVSYLRYPTNTHYIGYLEEINTDNPGIEFDFGDEPLYVALKVGGQFFTNYAVEQGYTDASIEGNYVSVQFDGVLA